MRAIKAWLLAACGLLASHAMAEPAQDEGSGAGADLTALTVEGVSSEPGDDDPRILYILPWQPPSIPRRPNTNLSGERPELLAPIDPLVFERHRRFRENLNPDLGSTITLN